MLCIQFSKTITFQRKVIFKENQDLQIQNNVNNINIDFNTTPEKISSGGRILALKHKA